MTTPIPLVLTKHNVAHLDLIKNALPDWILNSSPRQLEQLKNIRPELPDWFKTATAAQHKELRSLQTDSWTKRNDVEDELKQLLDIYSFAELRLKKHLKRRFQLDIDVKETFIHLYIPSTLPILGAPTAGATSWSVSVLDAALHNFEAFEGEPDAHLPESGFTTRPDANGRFRVLDQVTGKMPVAQFIAFCRELNIGGHYNAHLKEALGLYDRGKQLRLKTKIIDSHRAELKAALHRAGMTHDIQEGNLQSLLSFIAGRNDTWQTYGLSVLSTPLTGPLIFAPGKERPAASPIVVYIPHDPTCPLKQYPSMAAFMTHLTQQLRSDSYKQFFSRFIQHDQLAGFYWTLKRRYFHVIEDRPNAPGFAMPEHGFVEELRPIPQPSLDYTTSKLPEDIWEELYSQQLAKIFNDASVIAVSTGSEDRKTRHDRWERIKGIGLFLFNAAVFVIAPFVPVVGELMLLQMTYQLLEDAYEGVRDWAQGKSIEAFEHLFAIVESVLQAGGFIVGGRIVGNLIAEPSAFVQNLKPVVSNDGRTRLWNPDPAPYAHPIEVPPTSKPNELGLHRHNSRTFLKLPVDADSQHTLVLDKSVATEPYTLVHPTRPDAYGPRMEHNGQGAWLMEGEQPQSWTGTSLMRRLGHVTEGFSDAELERLRIISGTDEGVLRRVHLQNEAMPPLLNDTLVRFRTYRTVKRNIEHLRAGEAMDTQGGWLEPMATQMDGWPSDKALEVFADSSLTGTPHHFGNSVPPADTLQISLADVNDGKLAPLIADRLDEQQLSVLLGADVPKEQVLERINAKLADHADRRRADIFEYEYGTQRSLQTPEAAPIESTFPELPAPLTRALLDTARPSEKVEMTDKKRIPLRLKNLAREMSTQSTVSRAQEGLLEDDLLSPEGEKLTLNTVKVFSDAISNMHIEVRDNALDGTLRHQHRPTGATIKRVLVRQGPGRYEVRDADNQLLHPARRFHDALLKALPPQNLGNLTSRFRHGETFEQWLLDKHQAPGQVRTALDLPSVGTSVSRETETLLRGPLFSRLRPTPDAAPAEVNPLAERLRKIYPTRDEAQINDMLGRLDSDDQLQKLVELENEKDQLFGELDRWARSLLGYNIDVARIRATRREVSRRIKESWLRADKEQLYPLAPINYEDMTLTLDGILLSDVKLEDLTLSKKLDHVGQLSLNGCGIPSSSASFLSNFPELQILIAADNNLQRLPEALNDLPKLLLLHLQRNKIVIDPSTVDQLQNVPLLISLDLSQNPLGLAPDISRLPELNLLALDRTQITDWPPGLFSHPRPGDFDLSLQGNEITTVPDCEAGSAKAWIVVQTRLDRQKLDLENDMKLTDYRRSFGLDPHRTYPPLGDSSFWLQPPVEGDVDARIAQWNALEREHGSQGFFEVIARLKVSEDTFQTDEDWQNYENDLPNLTKRVWRVIDAASKDTKMREKLFRMASAPANCADAGAQIFNAMGIETMVYEFYQTSAAPQELERNLVRLARGKARLDKLYEIARADIAQRVRPVDQGGLGLRFSSEVVDGQPGTVDEVEVHTAYQTQLAKSLELPWVSEHMVYRDTADVTNEKIVQAYRLVQEGERHGGLLNQMLEVDFWDTYLTNAHRRKLKANDDLYEAQSEQLEDLRDVQRAWVESSARLEDRDAQKKQATIELAGRLGLSEADVLTEETMPDSLYNRTYSTIADKRQELRRALTREALALESRIQAIPGQPVPAPED